MKLQAIIECMLVYISIIVVIKKCQDIMEKRKKTGREGRKEYEDET